MSEPNAARKRDRFRRFLSRSPGADATRPSLDPLSSTSSSSHQATLPIPPSGHSSSRDGSTASASASPHADSLLLPGSLLTPATPTVSALSSVRTPAMTASHLSPESDLWGEAVQQLSETERAVVIAHGVPTLGNNTTMLQTLLEHLGQKRERCETNRWKFEFNGRSWELRDVADRVFSWLEKFKQIGDVAVTADPIHAGLPWAGIRFILQVVVQEREQMGALLLGLDKMLYLIDRCKIYEMLYLGNRPANPALKSLLSALLELYVLILRFISKAIGLLDKSTSRRATNAFWNPDDLIVFESKCQKLEERVEIEAQICERCYTATSRQQLGQCAERLQSLLKDLDDAKQAMIRVDTTVATLWRRSEESERVEILQWTSNIPYEDDHRAASRGRVQGTGEWLLEHRQYQEWKSSDESTILWLHGIPGAGKTKLVSNVIDNLLDHSNKAGYAYFYCDRNQASRRDLENILNTFVKQLAFSPTDDALHTALVHVYSQKRRTGFSSAKLSLEESESLLPRLLQAYSQSFLILDALDECCEIVRGQLISIFNGLIGSNLKNVKIFISSRRDPDIKFQLERRANIGIEATDNEEDIRKYVADRLEADHKRRHNPIAQDLRDEIIQTLFEKSGGMFQWASLQLSQLLVLKRPGDIRARLGRLPKDLKAAYDEIYMEIQEQDGSMPEIASRAFQWMICSQHPLSGAELVAAVCQDPDGDGPGLVDIDIETVLGACRNLIDIDVWSPMWAPVKFSHLSVQEYFESQHWSNTQANGLIAKVCLLLLNHPENWQLERTSARFGRVRPRTALHHLVEYARLHWFVHVRGYGNNCADSRLSGLLGTFLGSMHGSGRAYREWYGWRCRKSNQMRDMTPRRLSPPTSTSLAICYLGLYGALPECWKADFRDVEQRNEYGQSLLELAVLGGSLTVVEALLTLKADVNAKTKGWFGSALVAAAVCWNGPIVRMLLDSGADVNAEVGGAYGSPLVAVAAGRCDDINCFNVELDNHVTQGKGWSHGLLAESPAAGGTDVVRMLLDSGADVNMYVGSEFGSALVAAAIRGNAGIVRMLLDSRADVNAQVGGDYGSALVAATARDNAEIVRMLLDWGADVNAHVSGDYGSALVTAMAGHNEDIARMLLDSGADVNAHVSKKYGNALVAAVAGDKSKDLVRLLLDSGADVNAKVGGYFGSALVAAVAYGHNDIARMLLDSGADVNMHVGGEYDTALKAACEKGLTHLVQPHLVQLLLERGASDDDVPPSDHPRDVPLCE